MSDKAAVWLAVAVGAFVFLRRRRATPIPGLGDANAPYLAGPGRFPYGE